MKLTLIGVGSFVFGPSAIYDAIIQHELPDLHLALVDSNPEMVELMAGVARRMARDAGRQVCITTHTKWTDALDGSDFVLSAVAVQLRTRSKIDAEIIQRVYPEHLITEFCGVSGISSTLRQIAMVSQLATDMRRQCPKAWLLSSSNPLPRVCQAAHEAGIRTAGFCSASSGGFSTIGELMLGEAESYPWTNAMARYEAVMAGTNHLTFMIELRDRATGLDVNAAFVERALRPGGVPLSRTRQLMEETGFFPPNGDGHMQDFLSPNEFSQSIVESWHGSDTERVERLSLLRGIGEGTLPIQPLLDHRSWEHPVDFVAALTGGEAVRLNSLNLVNEGQITNLPLGVFVETPVMVSKGCIQPTQVTLPEKVAKYAQPAAELNDALTHAALRRDRAALRGVVEMDPTILEKDRAWTALAECVKAHEDLIGAW